MIDISELRRLAQAALVAPDGLSAEWMDRLGQFQESVSPAAIIELLDRLEAAEGERDALRAKIEQMEQQVPICRAEDLRHADSLLPSLGLQPEDNLYALPGAQAQPALDDEYGSTDFGYTFSGIELQEGDKRLMSMLVKAFGSDHPAVDDLTALLFRVPAQPAPVWPPLPSCGGPLCSDSEHHPLCRYSAPEAKS